VILRSEWNAFSRRDNNMPLVSTTMYRLLQVNKTTQKQSKQNMVLILFKGSRYYAARKVREDKTFFLGFFFQTTKSVLNEGRNMGYYRVQVCFVFLECVI
jgi:hypothetical protein